LYTVFFFTAPAPPKSYTLSLHDALPIYLGQGESQRSDHRRRDRHGLGDGPFRRAAALLSSMPRLLALTSCRRRCPDPAHHRPRQDRKSTRLNSSHVSISYAVFCLKKKNK